MEESKISGLFAVKVGSMWAKTEYGSELKLTEKADTLLDFNKAYKIAKKTGGKIYQFKPQEISDDELKTYVRAAGIEKDED